MGILTLEAEDALASSDISTIGEISFGSNELGRKQYELKDHLGNVYLVISDRIETTTFDNAIAGYEYYPFGMALQKFESEQYRYGFNGMEKDDEVKGNGNSYDFGARIYDSRLGNFLSLDPLAGINPFLSPYSFAALSPIKLIDRNGEDPFDPRTGTSYDFDIFSAVIWNVTTVDVPMIDKSLNDRANNKLVRSIARSGSNEFSMWGEQLFTPFPVMLWTSDEQEQKLIDEMGERTHRTSCPGGINAILDISDASKSGTYTFINEGYAEETLGIKRSSFEVVSVVANEVEGTMKYVLDDNWGADNDSYYLESITEITYENFDDTYSRTSYTYPSGGSSGGSTNVSVYQDIKVLETTTTYDKDGNSTGTSSSTSIQTRLISSETTY